MRPPITTPYTPRTEPTTSYGTRTLVSSSYGIRDEVNTSYTERLSPGRYCMSVIITGLWDDLMNWEDNLIWWDDGEKGTGYTTRTTIITTYT